ncbi:Crp/Fnr family transcriptional regulator [Leptolyngbya sp. FACHB-541]|uniref:Crp/Fnr family transcriptional regulator n=1 Tax=Leptolyngbya sp. FACHB-541 TaxID=2692810 RepID=UPI001687BD7D|nr:Crp/Fnr family transcriptional regulator [Leptolyngbya sp. FACHB-541]MBD1997218.1 Crp/Fnr family transcriptional regulator [Leptolyngbya sp. FACHB-541]
MQVTIDQLQQIPLLSKLDLDQLAHLQARAAVKHYLQGEIILHEGDRLPAQLFAVLSGRIEIKKTASTGKETILRTLPAGELFAAPALFGDGVAPATVVAEQDCQILTVERTTLLEIIQNTPEVALQIIAVLTERLQHLHQVVHGLVSERAIVRLAQFIQAAAIAEGTDVIDQGLQLRSRLPYYQIARSIGITYEECVRLFKQIQTVVTYRRGGKILVLDQAKLDAIANGHTA